MTRFTRTVVRLLVGAIAVSAAVQVGRTCGIDATFRAYLDKGFWRVPLHTADRLIGVAPNEQPSYVPYAGVAADGDAALQAVRDAYRGLFTNDFDQPLQWPEATLDAIREQLRGIQPRDTAQADELDLLRCKIDLRSAEGNGDDAIQRVQSCFESYLAQPRTADRASEARGWLARTLYLQGRRADAAKIYLDELASPATNIRRARLLSSLEVVYRGDRLDQLAADADALFDTPMHALFVADRLTNARKPELLTALITRLEAHKDLFRQGPESDALTLSIMRAATTMGAPSEVLRYAGLVPAAGTLRRNAEYNWLVGSALVQQQDYSRAAVSLQRAVDAGDSPVQSMAAYGLIGVYDKLHRPVDQLRAAFLSLPGQDEYGLNLDLPYLLDVLLTDAELGEYVKRYGNARDRPVRIWSRNFSRTRTPTELVRYALAVRSARREDFGGAAKIYEDLRSLPRARRMRQAEQLFAATKDASKSPEARLQARFDYAAFLADNSNGIFFNDSIWQGIQREVIMRGPTDIQPSGRPMTTMALAERAARFSAAEQSRYQALDRKLRDEQEEYWRAFQIFDGIVRDAGASPLGRQAAQRAIVCLRRIQPDRFGRQREIQAADIRLSRWLAAN